MFENNNNLKLHRSLKTYDVCYPIILPLGGYRTFNQEANETVLLLLLKMMFLYFEIL